MLWTTNTGAFYWWHFHNIEIPLRDPEAHCCASCCSMIMHGPMLQRSVHNSWKLKNISVIACPAYSPDMSLIEHVWDALDWRIRQRVPVPANIQHSHWRGVDQHYTHATINNLINSMQRRCVALHEANGGHTRYWLVFGPPNTVKLHILESPCIVASLRHTCAIIMLSNQHLDMSHLWGGWIISAKEKSSLTQIKTDLWTIFERNKPFVYIEKVLDLWVQLMKNEGKNKSVVLIILFSVILQYKCTIIIIIIIITIIMIIIILAFG